MTKLMQLASAGLSAALVFALSGCALIEALEEGGGLVNVFTAHHGTPGQDGFPDNGSVDEPRVFETDEGWTILLSEGYVTTAAVDLIRCDGHPEAVEMYWGPCAEDLIRDPDIDGRGMGGVNVDKGSYCTARVLFDAYNFDEELLEHQPPNMIMDGATAYFRGRAERGADVVDFEWADDFRQVIDLDLSTVDNGGPLYVEADAANPTQLTLGKAYDRFFDGIDFNNYSDEDIRESVRNGLRDHSRAFVGPQASAMQYGPPPGP